MADELTSPAAQKLAELGLELDPGIRYDLGRLFPKLTGWGANGQIKRRHKMIRLVEGKLKAMLQPSEEVLYVAKGVQYKLSEQYFLGAWAATINQTVFILTNLRLLMMNTNSSGKPRHTYWAIYYSQIKEIKPTWTGTVVLKLKDGTELKFTGFSKASRQHMPQIFQEALNAYRELDFDPPVTQSRENLCSFCMQVVPKDQYTCPACGAEFWRPKQVAMRSLVFPPWGEFLLGHYGLATLKLIGFLFVALLIVHWIDVALQNPVQSAEIAVLALHVLAIEHGIAALVTYQIARKGLHPKTKPGPQTARLA